MGPSPKKSPKMMIAIIAIVAVVAIVAVLFLFVLGGGQATPEAAVETLVSKINSGDFNGAIETTMYHFASPADKTASANDLQGWIPATASFQVSGVTVVNKDQMSQDDRDAAVELKLEFESMYGIVIEDYAKVTGTITVSNQGETGNLPLELFAFKVDGSWYLDF
ncbi:MAG: hypothetical protein QCI38_01635 [Candidatus Thermoplasmatota archaeon]|nr:hypothetical protein [Candidatus Thermoplasmatota archaeon]